MTNIMIEISTYLAVATLLGLLIGWLFTRTRFKEKYEEKKESLYRAYTDELKQIDMFEKELGHYKEVNNHLIEENSDLNLRHQGQKFVLDENNSTLDKFQRLIRSKDNVIEKLTRQLSFEEEKRMAQERLHSQEIDRFLVERIHMSDKFKEFTEKQNRFTSRELPEDEPSWFDKFFPVASKN